MSGGALDDGCGDRVTLVSLVSCFATMARSIQNERRSTGDLARVRARPDPDDPVLRDVGRPGDRASGRRSPTSSAPTARSRRSATSSAEFGQSTLENWQSEFLQLFSFVVLAALYIHKGSAESKDGDEKLEASLRRIEEHLGTLPATAPTRMASAGSSRRRRSRWKTRWRPCPGAPDGVGSCAGSARRRHGGTSPALTVRRGERPGEAPRGAYEVEHRTVGVDGQHSVAAVVALHTRRAEVT